MGAGGRLALGSVQARLLDGEQPVVLGQVEVEVAGEGGRYGQGISAGGGGLQLSPSGQGMEAG